MTNANATLQALIESHDYPVLLRSLLEILMKSQSPLERNKYLESNNIESIEALKEPALEVVLDYAELCLLDGILSPVELHYMKMLQMYFHIEPEDYEKFGKMDHVKSIILKQLQVYYADNYIDDDEVMAKGDLQGLFGISYGDFDELAQIVARLALERGADTNDLDTIIVNK